MGGRFEGGGSRIRRSRWEDELNTYVQLRFRSALMLRMVIYEPLDSRRSSLASIALTCRLDPKLITILSYYINLGRDFHRLTTSISFGYSQKQVLVIEFYQGSRTGREHHENGALYVKLPLFILSTDH